MVTGQVSRRQSDNDDNTSPLYETIPELDVIEEPQSFIPGQQNNKCLNKLQSYSNLLT